MPRTKSQVNWLQEHFNDPFVKKAQVEGYRSRAVYKIKEIDEKDHLLKPGMVVVDLGAAPGGWTQYISQKLAGTGKIIALDILPMAPIPDVEFIQGDFTEEEILKKLMALIPVAGVDLLVSDMAPNMSGTKAIDIPKAMYLAELALDLAFKVLKPKGKMLIKVFQGAGFEQLLKEVRGHFERVVMRKPRASRSRSKETYLLANGYNL